MKLLVVSDTHGDYCRLSQAFEAEKDADAIIYLGDGIADAETLQDEFPSRRIYMVRGNCDYSSFAPAEGVTAFDGVLMLYTHGHLYGVKRELHTLAVAAKRKEATIALYGHTHYADVHEIDGVTLFNPGALSGPRGSASYGIITLTNGKAQFAYQFLEQ